MGALVARMSLRVDCACARWAAACRYNPQRGEITLTSEKFPEREQNRRELLDMVHALIAEGERKHPQTDPALVQQQQKRKAARESLPPVPAPEYNPLRKLQEQ